MSKMVSNLKGHNRKAWKYIIIFTNLSILIAVLLFYPFQTECPYKPKEIKPVYYKDINEFACHYDKTDDALKPIDKSVVFNTNSIFFIESSCNSLNSRQACAVESAARANPDREVHILFTSPVSKEVLRSSVLTKLLAIDKVSAARIHLENYAEGTPLYEEMKKRFTSAGHISMNLPEILKFLTLYKYSGLYIDMDMITARPFYELKENWVIKETPGLISSSIFSFSANRTGRTLSDIALKYVSLPSTVLYNLALIERDVHWTSETPGVMNKLIQMWCAATDVVHLVPQKCKDLSVLESEFFYPISSHEQQTYFKPDLWEQWKLQNIYLYQISERFTKHAKVTDKQFFGKVAKEYCPMIFNFYGDKFGMW